MVTHRGARWRAIAVGACLAAGLAAVGPPAAHADIVPTTPLTDGHGQTVGYATSEPGVYFAVPSGWGRFEGGRTPAARITVVNDCAGCHLGPDPGLPHVNIGATFDLRLTVAPDYGRAAPAVVAVLQQDPSA